MHKVDLGKAFNPYALPSYIYTALWIFVLYYETLFQQENSLYLFFLQEFSRVMNTQNMC